MKSCLSEYKWTLPSKVKWSSTIQWKYQKYTYSLHILLLYLHFQRNAEFPSICKKTKKCMWVMACFTIGTYIPMYVSDVNRSVELPDTNVFSRDSDETNKVYNKTRYVICIQLFRVLLQMHRHPGNLPAGALQQLLQQASENKLQL